MSMTAMVTREQQTPAEVRLWQAVIVTTIQEWISGPLRAKRQAEDYLFKDPTDFALVCQSAGMDVGRLRAQLTRLRPEADAHQESFVNPFPMAKRSDR